MSSRSADSASRGTPFGVGAAPTDATERSGRSAALVLVAQVVAFGLRFLATLVLARLLTPEDYGLYAIVAAVFSLGWLFRDLGLGLATVQDPEPSHARVSTLFWINVGLGLALCLGFAAMAPLLSRAFAEPRLAGIAMVSSVVYAIDGVTTQHHALLRREVRAGLLGAIDVVSVLAGVSAAIFAARAGAGYWALVAMPVAIALATALAVWTTCPWRPGPPARGAGVRPKLAFGGHLTLFGVLQFLFRNADSLLIGWRFGPRPLGFYDKAYQLMLMPSQLIGLPLAGVALPVLSRAQDDPERHRRHYRVFVLWSAGLGMPLVAFLAVTADRVFPLLLGDQWGPSVPIFRALAPAAFCDALAITAPWIYLSSGQTARQLGFNIVTTLVTVLAVVVSVPWGPVAVAAAFSLCRVLLALPALAWACGGTHLLWTEVAGWALPPAGAALFAAAAVFGLERAVGFLGGLLVALATEAATFGALYAAAFWVWPRAGLRARLGRARR